MRYETRAYGHALYMSGKPVAYYSRPLTAAELNACNMGVHPLLVANDALVHISDLGAALGVPSV